MITSVQLFTLALFLLVPLASARAQDALPEGTGKKRRCKPTACNAMISVKEFPYRINPGRTAERF